MKAVKLNAILSKPLDSEYEKILTSLDIISKNVDEISEFRVIGGEPLMNKKWAEIVDTLQ